MSAAADPPKKEKKPQGSPIEITAEVGDYREAIALMERLEGLKVKVHIIQAPRTLPPQELLFLDVSGKTTPETEAATKKYMEEMKARTKAEWAGHADQAMKLVRREKKADADEMLKKLEEAKKQDDHGALLGLMRKVYDIPDEREKAHWQTRQLRAMGWRHAERLGATVQTDELPPKAK